MIKVLSSVACLSLLCAVAAYGQLPECSSTFVELPGSQYNFQPTPYIGMQPTPPFIAIPDYSIQFFFKNVGKRADNMDSVYLRAKHIIDGTKKFSEWTALTAARNYHIFYNGTVQLTYERFQKESNIIQVFAQSFTVPQMTKLGMEKLITTKIPDRTQSFPRVIRDWTYHASPNREFNAMVLENSDLIQDQLDLPIVMLNNNFEPLWERTFQLPSSEQEREIISINVSDNGDIYILMVNGQLAKWTRNTPQYSYKIYKFSEDGMESYSMKLPNNDYVYSAEMGLVGNQIRLAGLYFNDKDKYRAGYFVATSEDLFYSPISYELRELPFDIENFGFRPDFFQRSDGGSFFIFHFQFIQEDNTFSKTGVVSMDKTNTQEWFTSIYKHPFTSLSIGEYWHIPLLIEDKLIILKADSEDNLDLYNRGEVPSTKKTSTSQGKKSRNYLSIGFLTDGQPVFESFKPFDGLVYDIPLWSSPMPYKLLAQRRAKGPIGPYQYALQVRTLKNYEPDKSGLLYLDFRKP